MSSLVLPGDVVPNTSSSTLKLGPGLLQLASNSHKYIISTRAGLLNQTANGSSFWVESNSRRVGCVTSRWYHAKHSHSLLVVCTCRTRIRNRRGDGSSRWWRGIPRWHWFCSSCTTGWIGFWRSHKTEPPYLKGLYLHYVRLKICMTKRVLRRLGRWYTLGYPWPTKTWNPSLSALMHRVESPRVLANSRADSWSNAA